MERQEIAYIIPANSKRSMLLFGFFRPLDLGIFLVGIFLSLIFLIIFNDNSLTAFILKLLPASICIFLILPLPNYHNVRVLIREIYEYFMNRRVYVWKGWCFASEYSEKNRK